MQVVEIDEDQEGAEEEERELDEEDEDDGNEALVMKRPAAKADVVTRQRRDPLPQPEVDVLLTDKAEEKQLANGKDDFDIPAKRLRRADTAVAKQSQISAAWCRVIVETICLLFLA